jgi:hypothetical protein
MEIDDPTRKDLSARVIDIVAPIGKGQRRTHIPPESMFGVLICPEFGISARFLEPWDPEEKARKDVGRCLCRRVRGLGTGDRSRLRALPSRRRRRPKALQRSRLNPFRLLTVCAASERYPWWPEFDSLSGNPSLVVMRKETTSALKLICLPLLPCPSTPNPLIFSSLEGVEGP